MTTKAPRRPVRKPAGGGALRVDLPRGDGGRFVSPSAAAAPAPQTPSESPPKTAPPKRAPSPTQLVARVTRAIERELSQIEEIVAQAPSGPKHRANAKDRAEADKRARTLASLARTLAEVIKLRDLAHEPKVEDDDALPRDLDDFRATLERRLARLVDPPEDAAHRGDDAA